MASGTLTSWAIAPGDSFGAGDVLAQVETDKATVDFESQDDGYLAKILVPDGTPDVPVGHPVAIFVDDAADVAAFEGVSADQFLSGADSSADAAPAPAPEAAPAPAPAPAAAAPAPAAGSSASSSSGGSRVFASPAAKRILRENGLDLAAFSGRGTGPNGRVLVSDVQEAMEAGTAALGTTPEAAAQSLAEGAAAPSAGVAGAGGPILGNGDGRPYVDLPVPAGRLETAALMTASKQGVPHYYLTTEVTLDKVLALRQRLNGVLGGDKEDGSGLSLNDVIVKAAGLALKRVPAVNSSWNAAEGTVRQYGYADIGVVVSAKGGISAPVVRDADTSGLGTISARVAELAAAAADGSLSPKEAAGATFTVTNLGGYGVKQFAPVIVPPQAASLGVGAVARRVVPATGEAAAAGNKFTTATTVAVTLSCDHRVVDGAVGAEWLAAFKGLIEEPETMLL